MCLIYLFFVESSQHLKKELKIDKNVVNDFFIKDVMTFWNERLCQNNLNLDNDIINLFSLFFNKINQYSQKWDRSALIMVIIIYLIPLELYSLKLSFDF